MVSERNSLQSAQKTKGQDMLDTAHIWGSLAHDFGSTPFMPLSAIQFDLRNGLLKKVQNGDSS